MTDVTMMQPCPPHSWSHAPTVGYFQCCKCNERINYDDPRYTAMLADHENAIAKIARQEAVEVTQADILRQLDRAIERIMGVEIEAMGGDNLAVLLCSHFEDADDDSEPDDNGWRQSALDAYEEIREEITGLFVPVREALSTFARHRQQAERDVIARMEGWKPIETAPYDTPVEVRVGSMTFLARLLPDASMSSLDETCDQWQAEIDGEHPPCWSEGACWSSNVDEVMSLQPTAWRYPTPPEAAA